MRLSVDLIISLLFSPLLSVSLSGHLCVFPLRGNLPANPPSNAIYRNYSCLKILHPVLCLPQFNGFLFFSFIYFFGEGCFKKISYIAFEKRYKCL